MKHQISIAGMAAALTFVVFAEPAFATEHVRKFVIYEGSQRLVTLEIDAEGQCEIVSRRDIVSADTPVLRVL